MKNQFGRDFCLAVLYSQPDPDYQCQKKFLNNVLAQVVIGFQMELGLAAQHQTLRNPAL